MLKVETLSPVSPEVETKVILIGPVSEAVFEWIWAGNVALDGVPVRFNSTLIVPLELFIKRAVPETL